LGQLFVPLLCSVQQANDLTGTGPKDENSAQQSAALLAGELLRDVSFAPSRSVITSATNRYLLDFLKESFRVETEVFSTQSGTEALFRVTVNGQIRGDEFRVLDVTTGNTLFSFTRYQAEKRDFFEREFPFLAQEARKDPTMFGEGNKVLSFQTVSLTLGIPLSGKVHTVKVESEEGSLCAEVKNPSDNAVIMKLPVASLNNIGKLVQGIADFVNANPSAMLLMAGSADTHSLAQKAP